MREKRISHGYHFRVMKKEKGSHLKRPQIHFGWIFGKVNEYQSLSDTQVIEIRDWLSRYINTYVKQAPLSETLKQSRVCAHRILKNINRIEAE